MSAFACDVCGELWCDAPHSTCLDCQVDAIDAICREAEAREIRDVIAEAERAATPEGGHRP